MFYLILAILSSAAISILMRYSEEKIENNMGMFIANYLVCSMLSIIFMNKTPLFTKEPGMNITLLIGIITGVLYLLSFILLKINIAKNGVVLGATFAKLGVIIPTLMAILIFKEEPKLTQIIGIILTISAILIINYEKGDEKKDVHTYLLLLLLLFGGLSDSMTNIYDKVGTNELKDHYLLYTFFFALIFSIITNIFKHGKLNKYDVLIGLLLGIPNYFSSRFILLSLESIPALIVFPVFSIDTLITVSLFGLLLFKEKLNKKKIIGLSLIILSLVLLNI